jgi:hypothetical protein
MWKFLFIAALAAPTLAAGAAMASSDEGGKFEGKFSAAQEVPAPAVDSDGEGRVRARFDDDLSKVFVEVKVKKLTSAVTMAHLHCAPAGQNGLIILDLQPQTGSSNDRIVRARFDNDDLTGADCVAACGIDITTIAALRFAAEQGCIYANVHTTNFPLGEARAQLIDRNGGGSGKKRKGKN